MNRAQAYLAKTLPVAPSALDEIEEPPSVETGSGAPIADAIARFLGRYLACEPHQLTVLALWVIYTWCFERFSTATYLSIRSPESESGKSLCLELLELLCDSPWLAAGADPRTIANQLLSSDTRIKAGEDFVSRPPYTILLDDCHHALHGSDRQPLIAILNSGAHASGRYTRYRTEYRVFGPKAFAGNAPLPRSLASRCLPIVLHRRKPTDAISRLRFSGPPPDDAAGLLESVADWVEANADALAQVADEPPAGIPPGLSPHEQNCAEPLLHIADLIGGSWPERARTAISAVFSLAESALAVQLLFDIRACFLVRDNPEYLATRDLLATLTNLEYRAWSAWPLNSGRRLGALLHPFGIISRDLQRGSEKTFKGYLLRDFQDAFERYLPPIDVRCARKSPAATSSEGELPRLA